MHLKDLLPDLRDRDYLLGFLWGHIVNNSIQSKIKLLCKEISKEEHEQNLNEAEWMFEIYSKLGGNTKLGNEEFEIKKYRGDGL